jgi:hypothetical protein
VANPIEAKASAKLLMKKMRMTPSKLAAALLLTVAANCAAQPAPSAENPFTTAVAVWHMAHLKEGVCKNDLTIVGNVAVGKKLEGSDLQESLACGNDGVQHRDLVLQCHRADDRARGAGDFLRLGLAAFRDGLSHFRRAEPRDRRSGREFPG